MEEESHLSKPFASVGGAETPQEGTARYVFTRHKIVFRQKGRNDV
jgi:hypothetical protein